MAHESCLEIEINLGSTVSSATDWIVLAGGCEVAIDRRAGGADDDTVARVAGDGGGDA